VDTINNPSYSNTDDDGFLHLSEEDASVGLIISIDVDSQLSAIYHVFSMIEKSKNEHQKTISNLEKATKNSDSSDGPYTVVDQLVDEYHFSVYFDAANSMSTVGMIAPTLESILYETFSNIGNEFGDRVLSTHSLRLGSKKEKWDCHEYFFEKERCKKDINKGILQLINDTGMQEYLPNDFLKMVEAVFTYRNKMFHNGFEWPEAERSNFSKRIQESHWPDEWFSCSRSNSQPWIYYMSNMFQTRCMEMIHLLVKAIGRFYLKHKE
jgi:hypothetical protein